MAGDASNIRVWDSGDVFVFDPEEEFSAATHIPATIATAMPAAWLPIGMMLGDPGVQMPREIERNDTNAWKYGRVLTRYKNGKVDVRWSALEDNDTVDLLIDPAKVPHPVKTYLAMVFVSDDGYVERRFSKKPAHIWLATDDKKEDPTARELEASLYPSGTDIFTIQKGIPA